MYVGDLLVIWNNINFINQFLNALATWLFVKDLHDLYYFLAIEIIPIVSGLHLLNIIIFAMFFPRPIGQVPKSVLLLCHPLNLSNFKINMFLQM